MIAKRLALWRGYHACQAVTRHHAKSFYLASWALGPERRRGAFAVYAFCRRVDDAVDDADDRDPAALRAHVEALRQDVAAVFSHAPLRDPPLLALRDTVRRFGIERAAFDELIAGVALDIGPVRIASVEALDRYCYLVAGTVGLMMARLFGVTSDDALAHAIDLGKAMQLTNILRDVHEDYADKGRIYLPADRMAHYGVTPHDLRAAPAPLAVRELAAELAQRARGLYRSAAQGVPMIRSTGGRAATAIMAATYGEILGVLQERDWDMLAGRAAVTTRRKLWLMAGAVVATARGRATGASWAKR